MKNHLRAIGLVLALSCFLIGGLRAEEETRKSSEFLAQKSQGHSRQVRLLLERCKESPVQFTSTAFCTEGIPESYFIDVMENLENAYRFIPGERNMDQLESLEAFSVVAEDMFDLFDEEVNSEGIRIVGDLLAKTYDRLNDRESASEVRSIVASANFREPGF